jgi:hypothetical protein
MNIDISEGIYMYIYIFDQSEFNHSEGLLFAVARAAKPPTAFLVMDQYIVGPCF